MNAFVRRGRLVATVALSGALMAGLAGCSLSVSASDVQTEIANQAKNNGIQVDGAVSCPGDLPAEVGKTLNCTFTAQGTPYDAEAKVTAVDGSKVNYDISAKPKQ